MAWQQRFSAKQTKLMRRQLCDLKINISLLERVCLTTVFCVSVGCCKIRLLRPDIVDDIYCFVVVQNCTQQTITGVRKTKKCIKFYFSTQHNCYQNLICLFF